MFAPILRLVLASSLLGLTALPVCAAANPFAALTNAARVVFLGDSITYDGRYIAYLEAVLRARQPGWHGEFIDLGLPSETVSGLSEPGHAGGAFPRPDLHERLGRVLEKLKPNLVVACYGMNCGMYYPFSEERFAKYQDGLRRLRVAAQASGAEVLHLTPPPFDPVPLGKNALPAGLAEYRQPFAGYDDVLRRYSEWLLAQRAEGWAVADLHGPLTAHLTARRRDDPKFLLAGDGVHAGATGHWLMTLRLLDALGLPALIEAAVLVRDGAPEPAVAAYREQLQATSPNPNRELEMTGRRYDSNAPELDWVLHLPPPHDPQWDAKSLGLAGIPARYSVQRLRVLDLPPGQYELLDGTNRLATTEAKGLAGGLDLLRSPTLVTNRRAAEMLKLIQKRQRLLSDAWLNETGHKRPGMTKGLPVAEATQQAAALNRQIEELAQPVTLHLRLKPVAAP